METYRRFSPSGGTSGFRSTGLHTPTFTSSNSSLAEGKAAGDGNNESSVRRRSSSSTSESNSNSSTGVTSTSSKIPPGGGSCTSAHNNDCTSSFSRSTRWLSLFRFRHYLSSLRQSLLPATQQKDERSSTCKMHATSISADGRGKAAVHHRLLLLGLLLLGGCAGFLFAALSAQLPLLLLPINYQHQRTSAPADDENAGDPLFQVQASARSTSVRDSHHRIEKYKEAETHSSRVTASLFAAGGQLSRAGSVRGGGQLSRQQRRRSRKKRDSEGEEKDNKEETGEEQEMTDFEQREGLRRRTEGGHWNREQQKQRRQQHQEQRNGVPEQQRGSLLQQGPNEERQQHTGEQQQQHGCRVRQQQQQQIGAQQQHRNAGQPHRQQSEEQQRVRNGVRQQQGCGFDTGYVGISLKRENDAWQDSSTRASSCRARVLGASNASSFSTFAEEGAAAGKVTVAHSLSGGSGEGRTPFKEGGSTLFPTNGVFLLSLRVLTSVLSAVGNAATAVCSTWTVAASLWLLLLLFSQIPAQRKEPSPQQQQKRERAAVVAKRLLPHQQQKSAQRTQQASTPQQVQTLMHTELLSTKTKDEKEQKEEHQRQAQEEEQQQEQPPRHGKWWRLGIQWASLRRASCSWLSLAERREHKAELLLQSVELAAVGFFLSFFLSKAVFGCESLLEQLEAHFVVLVLAHHLHEYMFYFFVHPEKVSVDCFLFNNHYFYAVVVAVSLLELWLKPFELEAVARLGEVILGPPSPPPQLQQMQLQSTAALLLSPTHQQTLKRQPHALKWQHKTLRRQQHVLLHAVPVNLLLLGLAAVAHAGQTAAAQLSSRRRGGDHRLHSKSGSGHDGSSSFSSSSRYPSSSKVRDSSNRRQDSISSSRHDSSLCRKRESSSSSSFSSPEEGCRASARDAGRSSSNVEVFPAVSSSEEAATQETEASLPLAAAEAPATTAALERINKGGLLLLRRWLTGGRQLTASNTCCYCCCSWAAVCDRLASADTGRQQETSPSPECLVHSGIARQEAKQRSNRFSRCCCSKPCESREDCSSRKLVAWNRREDDEEEPLASSAMSSIRRRERGQEEEGDTKNSNRICGTLLVLLWCWVAGAVFSVGGLILRAVGHFTAGRSATYHIACAKLKEHTLVSHGVYSLCRHPGYAGFFYWAVGLQLMVGNVATFLLSSVVLHHFFLRRIIFEERMLERLFPDGAYAAYRAATPTIGIPFLAGRVRRHQENTLVAAVADEHTD